MLATSTFFKIAYLLLVSIITQLLLDFNYLLASICFSVLKGVVLIGFISFYNNMLASGRNLEPMPCSQALHWLLT